MIIGFSVRRDVTFKRYHEVCFYIIMDFIALHFVTYYRRF